MGSGPVAGETWWLGEVYCDGSHGRLEAFGVACHRVDSPVRRVWRVEDDEVVLADVRSAPAVLGCSAEQRHQLEPGKQSSSSRVYRAARIRSDVLD